MHLWQSMAAVETGTLENSNKLPRPERVGEITSVLSCMCADVLECRATVDVLARRLRGEGLAAAAYHAALPAATRADVLLQWRAGRLQVVVASVAFGMGVDKGIVLLLLSMQWTLDCVQQGGSGCAQWHLCSGSGLCMVSTPVCFCWPRAPGVCVH